MIRDKEILDLSVNMIYQFVEDVSTLNENMVAQTDNVPLTIVKWKKAT